MLYMLAMHAASTFMQLPRKPPVTAALIAVQTLIHLRPGKLDDALPTLSEVCLNPYFVIKVSELGPILVIFLGFVVNKIYEELSFVISNLLSHVLVFRISSTRFVTHVFFIF